MLLTLRVLQIHLLRLNWPHMTREVTAHTEIDYFNLMLPKQLQSLIITATNSVLGKSC